MNGRAFIWNSFWLLSGEPVQVCASAWWKLDVRVCCLRRVISTYVLLVTFTSSLIGSDEEEQVVSSLSVNAAPSLYQFSLVVSLRAWLLLSINNLKIIIIRTIIIKRCVKPNRGHRPSYPNLLGEVFSEAWGLTLEQNTHCLRIWNSTRGS